MWFDLATLPEEARTLLVLEGKDAARFVQGLVSADIKSMPERHALPASLLTVKAKLLSDAIVWEENPERFGLAVPKSRGAAMFEHIDRHIIMDELTVREDSSRTLALHLAAPSLPEDLAEALVRACTFPLPGNLWVGSASALEKARGELAIGTQKDFDLARIESGMPAWGRELSEQRLPPEAGFTASVSYSKGCFMGQEPLARIHARGQVNRVLVRVRAASQSAPVAGELPLALRAPESTREGQLCTWSDARQLGLAIVHRSLANPGQALQADELAFEVQSEALGDDQGLRKPR